LKYESLCGSGILHELRRILETKYIFYSERIGFRKLNDNDAEEFCKLNADPTVMRYFPEALSREKSLELLKRAKESTGPPGFCVYALDELSTGSFIGFMGFATPGFKAWFTPCTEILWRLHVAAWGKGYATEGAKAMLQFGFRQFGFTKVYAFTSLLNVASERVMQKSGMVREGEFNHSRVPQTHPLCPHVLYSITNSGNGI